MWAAVLEFLKEALCWLVVIVVLFTVGIILPLVIEDGGIKPWKKTVFAFIVSQIIPVFMLISGISAIRSGNTGNGIAMLVLAAAVSLGFTAAIVYSHKRGWKKDDDL
ncbi:MAG: hypothetical protein IJN53_02525 [Oscillospiraceae bacterium]|nr:hypothetical protein [Oscillospiraceae bacterium]